MQQPYPAVFPRVGNTWSTRSGTIGCCPSLVETLPQMIYRIYTATKMSRNLTLRLTNLEHSDSSLSVIFRKSRHYLIWVWYENCFNFFNSQEDKDCQLLVFTSFTGDLHVQFGKNLRELWVGWRASRMTYINEKIMFRSAYPYPLC